MITYQFDRAQLGAARAGLERLSKTLVDLWQTMDAIGAYLVASTQRRFERQAGPDGTPWKPSIRAQIEGGWTLLDSGHLRSSIAHAATRDTVEVGSNRIYAAIHQLGGTIRARNAPNLRFRIGGRWISKPSVTIPARPFLGLDQEDELEIDAIVQADLEAAVAGRPA
ncbi:MAG: phage virion morphogenesis protein [Reyranella sp.]|nr:phage virion morphogenesis protein [Reyranella sp.]